MKLNDLNSSLISFMYCACFPASNLTFAASYQNKNENVKQMAKYMLITPYSNPTSVVMLLLNPLWTDGNPPDFQKLANDNFCLCESMSTTTFMPWIITPTNSGIENAGIWNCMIEWGERDMLSYMRKNSHIARQKIPN